MDEAPKIGAVRRVPNDGKGRPKGAVNRNTKALKDMILGALEGAGGEQYLQRQATENPTAFMTLVGKVLPLQVTGDKDNPLHIEISDQEAAQRMAELLAVARSRDA